jgi:hypothetical protein
MISYNTTHISTASNIGDSLSAINLNYKTLDSWINNIQLSATSMWLPLINFYNETGPLFKNAFTTSTQQSGNWIGAASLVFANSAKWIKPITVFYPELFPYPLSDTNIRTIETWVNKNFPTNGTDTSNPNYVEGQQLVIHNFTYSSQSYSDYDRLTDYTQCVTNDADIHVYCVTRYSGYVYCSNGDFGCGGQSDCSQSRHLHCYYDSYPYIYISDNGNRAYSYITADVYTSFNNRSETKQINSISYKVKNCSWVLDKIIS